MRGDEEFSKLHAAGAYSFHKQQAAHDVESLIADANRAGHDITIGGQHHPAIRPIDTPTQ